MLNQYLEELESRIDPKIEEDLFSQWVNFWNNSLDEKIFAPKRSQQAPSKLEWPDVNINDAIEDDSYETMLLKELCSVNATLSNGNGLHMAIRPNYGSNIVPSLFGAEVYYMEHHHNTLPGAHHIEGGIDAIKKLIADGNPNLDNGQGKQVMECTKFFKEQLSKYPKLNKYCQIYHPDLQGAFDICEVVWGSEIFIDIFDYPQIVKDFMQVITDTYCAYIDRWFKLIPPSEKFNIHYGWIHPGKIRLSLDSCMNLSPEMYLEFVKPYDAQMLSKYGGVVHSCGRVEHFLSGLSDIEGYYGFNLSQPEYNNMETVYKETIDKGINIISLNHNAVEKAISSGRNSHNRIMVA